MGENSGWIHDIISCDVDWNGAHYTKTSNQNGTSAINDSFYLNGSLGVVFSWI